MTLAHISRSAGCSRRRSVCPWCRSRRNPDDVAQGHGEEAEGVIVPQILLGGEGKAAEVGEAFEVVGMDAVGL